MKNKLLVQFLLSIAILLFLTQNVILSQVKETSSQELSEPEKNFEYLWHILDMEYALFNAKHIDWKALYNVYRPQVNSKTTDDELFEVMKKLLSPLFDNHIQLRSENPSRGFNTGMLYRLPMPIWHTPEKYFKSSVIPIFNSVFSYRWLFDNIGYIELKGFYKPNANTQTQSEILNEFSNAIDKIISEFSAAQAIIIDLRGNGGGDGILGQTIANRFADKKRLFMTDEFRNGSKHNDFNPKNYWFVQPAGPIQYNKTTILLTDRFTQSAAEIFTLAMRVLPNVTVVGDFTSGCFASTRLIQLPNNWSLRYAASQTLDYKNICWEGIGIMPNIKVNVIYDKNERALDETLEMAMSLIKTGNLQLKSESGSLNKTESLVNILENNINRLGINKAIKIFNDNEINDKSEKYYLSFNEFTALGDRLIQSKRLKEGEKVYRIITQQFPNSLYALRGLGLTYLCQNKIKEAIQSLGKAPIINTQKSEEYSKLTIDYIKNITVYYLIAKGYDEMSIQLNQLKKDNSVLFREDILNNLGYELIRLKLFKQSSEILKLNTELYPNYANGYNSLAEAYMLNGDKDMAIKNYEKAVELNPRNTNAVETLKKLKEGK